MDSSFCYDTINLRYLGVSGYNCKKYCIVLSEDLFFTFTNSVDPDDFTFTNSAALYLGLHCLRKYLFRGFRI